MPSFLKQRFISNIFSETPPTRSLFRWSSGAILRYISKSSALWWVINGLAVAPPAWVWSIGVSTSRKPWPVKYSLIFWIIKLLFLKVSRTSSFIIISRYLFLYLVSVSWRPWNFSGKGWSDFVKSLRSTALIESSPLGVLLIVPVKPAMSPTSNNFKSLILSSDKFSLCEKIWIFPVSSTRSINMPVFLIAMIRPATEYVSSVSAPASKSLYFSWRAFAEISLSNE